MNGNWSEVEGLSSMRPTKLAKTFLSWSLVGKNVRALLSSMSGFFYEKEGLKTEFYLCDSVSVQVS